jgi:hypothetical protein
MEALRALKLKRGIEERPRSQRFTAPIIVAIPLIPSRGHPIGARYLARPTLAARQILRPFERRMTFSAEAPG